MRKGIFLIIMTILIGGCFYSAVKERAAKILADEFFMHPEIIEMDDGTRAKKYVNDIRISMDIDASNQKENKFIPNPRYYKNVLVEQGIKEKDFEYLKRRLTETGLRHYYKKDNYSIFVTGGMFGEIEGILVVHNNDSIPQEGFRLNDHYYIWIGSEIEKNVFWISGA